MLMLKSLNKLILGLCLIVVSVQTAAEGLNENLVETKFKVSSERLDVRDGWGNRLGKQPPQFEFLLTEKKEVFVRALYPESERFLKYGPTELDRNRPVRVTKDAAGLFEHEGVPYAVFSTPGNYQEDNIRYSILRLVPYVDHPQNAQEPKFGRDLLSGTAVLGFYGALAVSSVYMVLNQAPIFTVTALAGLAGTSIGVACLRPSTFKGMAEHQVLARCGSREMVNRDDRNNPGNTLSVEKVDANLPWSAENIRVNPRRGKARLLTTMLKRVDCEGSLIGFI